MLAISSTMTWSVCVVFASSGSEVRDAMEWDVGRRRREGVKEVEREEGWGPEGRARECEEEVRFIAL